MKSIILAAGKGTRMKSEIPKVLHKVNGKPMLQKIIEVLKSVDSIEENILILGHKKEEILNIFNDVEYVVQEEQLGTAHAIKQAEKKLIGYDGDIIILCGDTPLLRKETIEEFYENFLQKNSVGAVLTAKTENPYGYGRIIKDENENILKIVEEKDASSEEKKINEINTGVFIFKSKELFKYLKKIKNNNAKNEYYLTDIIEIMRNDGLKFSSHLLVNFEEMLGVNTKIDLEIASKILRKRKNKKLMEDGVILIDSLNTYIEENVQIGEDTIIYPAVYLEGNTIIGKNTKILSGTRIVDSKIGNFVKIESSVIEESIVEDEVTIGPFAHLRPKSHLKEKVHIGNFVEIKKSVLESGVKAGHLTYLGDSKIGSKTNIGAGTITCNYDGKNKFKTEIGENSFIGSDTILVAPVKIGDNSYVGAGSVITKEVPNKSLAVSRSKQIIKEGWKKNYGKF